MPNPLNVPLTPPRVNFIDPRTGNVSREWYMFFLSLFTLMGGSSQSLNDLQKAPLTQPELLAQIAELRKQIDALELQVQPQLGTLSTVNIDWVPYLGFDTPPPWIGSNAGQFWYDPTTGSFNAKMGNNNITQQVGEELFRYGKASSAVNDSPLQIVYKTGVVGASGVITFAPAVAGITDPDQIIGVATEPIATNGFGRVTTYGVVRNITTNGTAYGEVWADNDDIWYNPATGNPTKVKPVAPNIKLQIGTVIKAGSGGSGSFIVKLGSSSSLGGTDSNVQFGALTNGQTVIYDQSAGYWKNATLTAGSNVTITNGPGSITISAAGVSGASGSFTTADTPPLTVTVTNGVITSIV